MKNNLRPLTFLIASLSILSGNAQFDAIPDSNATWLNTYLQYPWASILGYYYHYDQTDPDTVIAGDVFKKLFLTSNTGGPSDYIGALRDNGSGQVFICDQGSTTPAIWCDFDVMPGDTVLSVFSWWMEDVLIHDVDTITINGTPRKRIALSCPSSPGWTGDYWIQGIGSTGGFQFTNTCGSVSGNGELVCMTYNGIVQFGSNIGGSGDCAFYLGELDTQPQQNRFIVFADPNSGLLSIQQVGPKHSSAQVTVFEVAGRALGTWRMINADLLIEMNAWDRGAYVVKIIDQQGKGSSHKFVLY
ncbi:MAG: T9SS type A sorting domain-containing protein [Flavobacteriales bacterium]|nr:T9SS type A sorting domain-containing protein [Flavobacteriales bacterium]MBK7240592.1 T9SS type A sorting domain-containing protein [Flavobacteriales bacterium]MBK7297268.1 T9SS type A sorting domain-containing protein [Flavobacteriales bacterium]MBK9535941.1 T9SS type A sorting domain-containing protein [Flavobacteriales bacterium]MBP9138880.1 T9SS type A sorting domain-containing protein [Flavobacteriales bacterium]